MQNNLIDIPAGARGEIRRLCPKCTPGHQHKRSKSLSINADRGIWHCFRCEWSGTLSGGDHHPSKPLPEIVTESPTDSSKRLAKLRSTWKAAIPLDHPEAQPARTYLRRRGLGGILDDLPADVRLHPALPYWDQDDHGQWHKLGEFPALVALVRGSDGTVACVHRTYLQPDGSGKADVPSAKKLMSPIIDGGLRGAAIRLYPLVEQLAIAEGIETALAVRVATNMAVWATISAGGMARLEVPEMVREVIIMADLDRNGVGEKAARALAKRLLQRKVAVKVVLPSAEMLRDYQIQRGRIVKSLDWCDVLNSCGGRHE